jgi:hypothetical protein
MPTTTKTASSTSETSRGSLADQGATLAKRALEAQKAVTLTVVDLVEKNTKVLLGATEKVADKTPVAWAADVLRKQSEFAGRVSVGYTGAVRSYLS